MLAPREMQKPWPVSIKRAGMSTGSSPKSPSRRNFLSTAGTVAALGATTSALPAFGSSAPRRILSVRLLPQMLLPKRNLLPSERYRSEYSIRFLSRWNWIRC